MGREELVAKVAEATAGTASDPLTKDEVAQVVDATLESLGLDADGKPVDSGRYDAAG